MRLFLGLLALSALAQTPVITGIVNEASREPRLCAGGRAFIQGQNLGSPQPSVTVGGRAAPVLGVLSDGMVAIQIPAELGPGNWPVVVTRAGVASSAYPITLATYAPALFDPVRLDTGFAGTAAFPLLIAPGEVVTATALCLGPTDPPLTTNSQEKLRLITPPSASMGGQAAEVLEAFHAGQGAYVVRLRVPAGLPDGPAPVVVTAGGLASNARTAQVSNLPVIRRVFDAAEGNKAEVAPGAIASIRAENLGPADQLTGFPATEMQGISVTFNGIPAPLYHLVASARQINVQVPTGLAAPTEVMVRVRSPRGESPPWPVVVFPVSAGIFRVAGAGVMATAAVLFANTAWRVMPSELARQFGVPGDCRGLPTEALCGQPAIAGDLIQIYATGLGPATPGGDPGARPIASGEIPAADGRPLFHTLARPIVVIGDRPAEVLFSGLTPGVAGLYQVNVRVPEGVTPGDRVRLLLSISAGGQGAYTDLATIAIAERR